MAINNFKKLAGGEEFEGPSAPVHIKQNVERQLGTFRFFGQIIDLYLSRVVDFFVGMAGGTIPDQQKGTPPSNTEQDPSNRG